VTATATDDVEVPDLADSDSDDDDCYYVSTAPAPTARDDEWSYKSTATAPTYAATALAIETVEAYERLYSKKKVDAAVRVKKFSAAMGHLSQGTLHEIVNTGRVQGLDFTHQDIERANSIYGPDLQAIRGKSVKRKNRRVESVVLKVIEPDLVMHLGIMFVAGLPFLVSILKPLMLVLATLIRLRSTADVKRAIDKQISTVQS
jgi:hypothetical protein